MIRVTKHNNLVSTVLDSVTENNIFIMPNILSPVANSEGLQGWHFKLGLDIISDCLLGEKNIKVSTYNEKKILMMIIYKIKYIIYIY